MERLEVSGAVQPIYGSLGVKWLEHFFIQQMHKYIIRRYD